MYMWHNNVLHLSDIFGAWGLYYDTNLKCCKHVCMKPQISDSDDYDTCN